MKLHERLQERRGYDDHTFDRALVRAGLIIIAGYLVGTLVAWLIVR